MKLPVFAVAVVITSLISLALQTCSKSLRSSSSENYAFVRTAIDRGLAKCSVICLGDSMVKLGISPLILQNSLKVPAYNLAVAGSSPTSTYYILRKVLKKGIQPRIVFVDFEPGILKNSPMQAIHESAELLTIEDIVDVWQNTGNLPFSSELLAAALFPLYRYRYELIPAANHILSKDVMPQHKLEALRACWHNNNGQTLSAAEDVVNYPWKQIIYERIPWSCNSVNELYMKRLFQLAETNGISIFWLLPPMHPGAQKECTSSGLDEAYIKFAKSLQAQFKTVTVIDARALGCSERDFVGGSHLSRDGSILFSAALGNWLSHNIETHNDWVNLQPVESRGLGSTLIDLDETLKILEDHSSLKAKQEHQNR